MPKLRYLAVAVIPAFTAVACASVPPQNFNDQVPVAKPFDDAAFESVCHLFSRRRGPLFFISKWNGSAVLYRGRYLLTAGHNVHKGRSSVESIEVVCGTTTATDGQYVEKIESWQAIDATGYDGKDFSRDFAVIRLNTPIAVTKPFELASSPVRIGEEIRFAGYPGGTLSGGKTLYRARGKVTAIADGVAAYDIRTFTANSGGPVWRVIGGTPELVAIHVRGYQETGTGGGRMVDADYLPEVKRMIDVLDARARARGR